MTRMDFLTYDYVLSLIEEDITKQDTHMRSSIKAGVRLAVTLRYLAHGKLLLIIYLIFVNSIKKI